MAHPLPTRGIVQSTSGTGILFSSAKPRHCHAVFIGKTQPCCLHHEGEPTYLPCPACPFCLHTAFPVQTYTVLMTVISVSFLFLLVCQKVGRIHLGSKKVSRFCLRSCIYVFQSLACSGNADMVIICKEAYQKSIHQYSFPLTMLAFPQFSLLQLNVLTAFSSLLSVVLLQQLGMYCTRF